MPPALQQTSLRFIRIIYISKADIDGINRRIAEESEKCEIVLKALIDAKNRIKTLEK